MYYIAKKIFNVPFVTFWLREGRGYTYDLREAGQFDEEYINKHRYNDELLFIPVDEIDEGDTIMSVRAMTAKNIYLDQCAAQQQAA